MTLDGLQRMFWDLNRMLESGPALVILAAALLVVALLLALLFSAHLRLRRRFDALRRLAAQQWDELQDAQRVLKGLTSHRSDEPLTKFEERLEALSREHKQLQEQVMLRDAAAAPYVQAIRQARQGAGIDELMATYDLGRAEAELIVALHVKETPSG